MDFRPTPLPGVMVIAPRRFDDARGFFMETYHAGKFAAAGLTPRFVQFNHARSVQHTLRGLHFQFPNPQAKLVRCLTGRVFDVTVDLRRGAATYGRWFGLELSADNGLELFIPEGFAHGYLVLSDTADVEYAVNSLYEPKGQLGIAWNDPDVAVAWPAAAPLLSTKDQLLPRLRDLDNPFAGWDEKAGRSGG
ncbi:MAG: dTDP-4-dehydrorhamnose 3,5-epimerase [Candidatus Riflebacteria bacterium]|nr:dTDP-4-dehydrorhamnose 3,5-epimerase [Candidatus Riflebacteria bacterium]